MTDRIVARRPTTGRWLRNLRGAPALSKKESALVQSALERMAEERYARQRAAHEALYGTPGLQRAPGRRQTPPAASKASQSA